MGNLIWTGEDNMKKKVFQINLFLLLILVMLLSASCGKNRATTMKLIKTDGEVGVENEKGKSVDLIDNLGLYSGYGIDTQTKSFAWIDLDDTKLTKMDEKSDVDIIKDGKKLELIVNSGGLFFNVTKSLEDDESMDIRTSTTICGIRGTCGWVESRGDTTYVGLLDGKVECSVTVDGKEETVILNAKEILIAKEDGTYEVKELTYKDVPEFVQAEIADEPFALEDESEQEGQEEISSVTARDFEGNYINQDTGITFSITALDDTKADIRWDNYEQLYADEGFLFPNGMVANIEGNLLTVNDCTFDLSGDQIIVTLSGTNIYGPYISGTYVPVK